MVKLKAPLLGASASGKLGDALQFDARRRGTVAGKRRRPRQPRTFAQMATRRYMTWLTKAWSELSAAEKDTWWTFTNARRKSPYHAYLAYNVNRFKGVPGNYLDLRANPNYPSAAYPASRSTEPGGLSTYEFSSSRTDVWLQFRALPFADHWITMFFYVTEANQHASYARLAHVEAADDDTLKRYHLPDAGDEVWRLWIARVSRTGLPQDVQHNYWSFPA